MSQYEEIAASNIEQRLGEIAEVLPDEKIVALSRRASAVIDQIGTTESTGTVGMTYEVTPDLATHKVGKQSFALSLRRTTQNNNEGPKSESFKTVDLLARAVDGSKIVCASLEHNILRVDFGTDAPKVNQLGDFSLFDTIVKKGELIVRQRDQQSRNDADRAARKRAELWKMTRRGLFRGVVGIGAGAVVFGGVKWMIDNEVFVRKKEKFDRLGHKLPGGSLLTIGQTVTPEFSTQLVDNNALSADKIPRLNYVESEESVDDELSVGDGLRQIEVANGIHKDFPWEEEKPYSHELPLKDIPLNARFRVWTDFSDSIGVSRANELTITYEKDKLVYGWNGRKAGNEVPRIVLQIEV